MDGLETLEKIKRIRPDRVAIVLTGQGSLERAVEAGRARAYDYQEKPSTPEAVHLRIQRAVEHHAVKQKLEDIESMVGDDFKGVVGKSPAIAEVFDLDRRVAPTDSTILIKGETGTGKELIASSPMRCHRRRDTKYKQAYTAPSVTNDYLSRLVRHEWPGNVIERALALCEVEEVDLTDLPSII